ncbi:LOW QUALITY PROTEIN: oligopeptide transport system permease protein OppC [Geomicrobium sp. JCM 19037]|nr:LOW QUALITY PROTEIN: oligopeptide transport system permease protein OppC [Geomicrobium sp. JCM 19037]
MPEAKEQKKSYSPTKLIVKRFFANKLAVAGVFMFLLVVIFSFSAPLFVEHDPAQTNPLNTYAEPSSDHWLGTNSSGQDNFARLVYGGQISLQVGVFIMLIVSVIGVVLGSISGYFGGWIDSIIMRITDLFLIFPFLLLVLTVVTILQNVNVAILVITLGLIVWPNITRILRGTYLTLREREFIYSARAAGATDLRIIVKHMIPNAIGPIIVNATIIMAQMIILESALSFIGFGIPAPTLSWGAMLNEARSLNILTGMPWAWMPPGIMIVITVLSINFIGDGLRDAFDPKSSRK